MSELPTKQDLEDFKSELQERLDLLKEQLSKIKKEEHFDEDKAIAKLIQHNARKRGISVKNYIQRESVDGISEKRLLNLCQDEIKKQSKNFDDDENIVNDDGEVHKIKIKANTPRDYSVRVGIGTVEKGADF